MFFARHRLPDRHPLDGEALDGLETFGTDGQGKGNESVQVIDVEDRIFERDVGGLCVDGATGTEKRQGGIAEHVGERSMGMGIEYAIGVARDLAITDTPAGRSDRTAMAVAFEGGGRVVTTDMADLALELDEMHGLVAEDVVVNHETDLGRQFGEEHAVGLGSHWPGVSVDGLDRRVGGGEEVNGRSTDLAILDEIAHRFLPSAAGGIVVPYRVRVTEQPGIEVTHCEG